MSRERLKAVVTGLFTAGLIFIVASSGMCAAEKPEIFLQLGHSAAVHSVAFSPDGRYILSGGHDRTLKLWDVSTGKELRSFGGNITSTAFSPDGRYILSGSIAGTPKLWDVETGRELHTFDGYPSTVESVAFSPDGRFALSGSRGDYNMKLWDVSTGKELRTFEGHSGGVKSVAFSPDGQHVLSGSLDKTLKLWDVKTSRELRTFAGHSGIVNSAAFSPDGRYILSGSGDPTLGSDGGILKRADDTMKLWEVKTGKELRAFAGDSSGVFSVAFSPDGRFALSAERLTLKLWEVETGKELRTFYGHSGWVYSVAFSPDGRYILSGSLDKTLKLWDVETGKELRTFGGYSSTVNSVAFSPDGQHVLSGSLDKTMKLWDVKTGRELHTFGGYSSYLGSVAFSPDGRFALSGSSQTMNLWDVKTGKGLRTFGGRFARVGSVAFSPDGRYIFSAARGYKSLNLWDIETGKELRTFYGHYNFVRSVAFSPDGQYVLSGGDKTMNLWDVKTGKELRAFAENSGIVNSVAFSPDGRFALSGSSGGSMKLWDVETGREIHTFGGRAGIVVNAVAFSPDGRFALSGSSGGSMKLWDVMTGREIRSFTGHSGPVNSVAFSPDGRFAVSGSDDTTTRIWDINTGSPLAHFISFTDGEWLAMTPDGHFNASVNGAKHLNVRIGNKVYSIDNFYEKFFDPGYVASVLQGKKVDTVAIADIRQGIQTPPDVRIVSPKPNATFNADTITIKVAAKDTGGGIDEIKLYHNGKAIGEDQRRLKLVSEGGETVKDYNVTLVEGLNTFRAVGFSKDRTESNPYELAVQLTAPSKDVSLHVLAVGINKYKNPALNLNYAVPDAQGIVSFFQNKGQLFKKVNIIELYDEDATKKGIIAKLNQLEKSNPQDAVLIYLAGHGDNVKDIWYFIPHELTYPEQEEEVQTKGLSSKELAGYISNIKAQKILMLVDACKAGAMLLAFRGFEDRKAIVQLSRSTGMHVVAASTKNQFAAEVKELGHGVFTYTLLQGLNGKAAGGSDTVTVRKLMGYIEEQLPEITKKYKQEAQFPVVDSRGMDFPLVIGK